MKLAKVDHRRCDEWRAATFVWVEDVMTSDELQDLCELAVKAFLAAEDAFEKDPNAPPDPGWSPQYDRYPDKTIAEVKADHEVKRTIRGAWDKRRSAARKTFSSQLVEASDGRICGFYSNSPEMVATVSWGHRHGKTAGLENTEVCSKDVNAPKPAPEEADDEWA